MKRILPPYHYIAFREFSVAALVLVSLISSELTAQVIAPTENLVVRGIPEIPRAMVDQVARYTESRAASFADWHPLRREMLISTRFGNTPQIHRVPFPAGARTQLTFFAEPVGSASYDPVQGEFFIYGRDIGGNEFSQLYRFDLATGESTLLTDGTRSQNGGVLWNHAGDQFVYSSTQRNGTDRDLWIINPRKPDSNRLLVELSGGGWRAASWSPDDSSLALIEYQSINQSSVWLLSVADGKLQRLTNDPELVSYTSAEFAPDGKSLYITTDKDSEYQRLARLQLDDGSIDYLTKELAWDVEAFELSPDGSKIVFATNEAGISRVSLYDTATGTISPVAGLPTGVVGGLRWHKNSRDIAFTINSPRSTSDVYTLDVQTGETARWTESELGGLNPNDISEAELVRWKSFDGKEITGFLFRPPARFEGKRPVIIQIHGGPEGQSRPTFQGRNNYFLNELGIAVIYPNVRGSSGFGKTFVALDNGLLREDSVKDIGALLDWIGDQQELDADRIMVTGGSYGGYMTLACATHFNDKIRCSLDIVGISHFGTFLKNTESYRRDLRRVEYGDERDPEIAEFFERISPLNNAERIKKPLFVVQGGNDPRVPLSEAEQIVARVEQGSTPVWYLMAKDEGHGFRKKSNADFQFFATVRFIQEYLLGD